MKARRALLALILSVLAICCAPVGRAASALNHVTFESGNISSISGGNSGANRNPIRTVGYIPLERFSDARVGEVYAIRYFAYDGDFRFLGTCRGRQDISRSMILDAAPECVFFRLLLSDRRDNALDPADPAQYGFVFREEKDDGERLSLQDLEPYSRDGVFTESFSLTLEGLSGDCPLILSCDAQYLSDGENIPTVQMFLNNQDDKTLYYSPAYQIGARDGFALKEWRVPPAQAQYNRLKITVYIPEGVTLRIRAVSMRAEENTRQTDEAIRYHAHQGFSGLCAQSTAYAFEMAGRMGYRSCITIPKFTSDGVCVCFHDDDTIRRKLRYDDGGQITAGSADDRPVSELSFAELMRFDAGLRKNEIYAGERVPTIDEFFEICARYHMAPVLSVHSSPEFYGEAGLAHFAAIRESAERYGVLQDLRIKSGNYRVQSAARSVFDKDIAGYILIQGQNSTWDPLLVARNSGFVSEDAESMAESEYWVVMEFFYAAATEEKLTRAKSEGFPLSIATTGAGISGPEQERLMGLGVTEFTIDHHCSMGLSW